MRSKQGIYAAAAIAIMLTCGCAKIDEPNETAYISAVGIDKTNDDRVYSFTIQFANPVRISGGGDSSGGERTTETITLESPSLFAAINAANQVVSKKFDLSHAKLIVFSEEIAQNGINDLIQVMSRNSSIRPNIYLAVSLCGAGEYIRSIDPMMELNPVNHYQLIFDNFNSLYSPNSLAHSFYFSENSIYADGTLPLVGILPDEKNNTESESSGSEGDKENGNNEYYGRTVLTEKRTGSFSYMIPDYFPGDFPTKTHSKTESIGMALFSQHRMTGKMGGVDCEIYNILTGQSMSAYIPYKVKNSEKAVTVRVNRDRMPKINIDVSGDAPKIKIKVELDGEITSVPYNYPEGENMDIMTNDITEATKRSIEDFLYKTSRLYQNDICEFGGYAKRKFLTNDKFAEYDWKNKYKNAEFDVRISFNIRRTGLILRNSDNIVER